MYSQNPIVCKLCTCFDDFQTVDYICQDGMRFSTPVAEEKVSTTCQTGDTFSPVVWPTCVSCKQVKTINNYFKLIRNYHNFNIRRL